MKSDPSYVIDTHPLIWHLAGARKLKSAARQALSRVERGEALGLIPAIVLAELVYLYSRLAKSPQLHHFTATTPLRRIVLSRLKSGAWSL